MARWLFLVLTIPAILNSAEVPPRTSEGPWRLQYHFTPPQNWTNDPNGLVYYKSEYHLFYQFNPFGSKWGHMSWGHAVSSDLLHWKDLPVALSEENGVMIFSGSAVVDEQNSSGLCQAADKDRSCMIAIYTGHTPERQTQNVAFSNDRGRTWTKYKGNPVIDLGLKNFRDPKVLWDAERKKWVMVTALSDQQKLRLFESRDLIHWKALSDFGPAGATGGDWECPDLFPLPVEGGNETRWVLVVNINPGGVAGGSGTQYFVGRFDGTSFLNENPPEQKLWMDYGKDYYAAISYFGHKPGDERLIMLGWFSNWQYANDTPETGWRGAMALPREVFLARTAEGIRVKQRPVREISTLREPLTTPAVVPASQTAGMSVDEANRQLQRATRDGNALEIEIEFQPDSSMEFGLAVLGGKSHRTQVGINRRQSIIYIDRSRSGVTNFSKHFPGRQEASLHVGDMVKLNVLVDRSSIELFANNGEVTFADRVYPEEEDRECSIFFLSDSGPRVRLLKVWRIKSVWDTAVELPHGGKVVPLSK
jgi:fructan beta-fructosidase